MMTEKATMGGAEFARYLATLGVTMTRQAVSKSQVIPKTDKGRVIVAEALAALQASGRLESLPGDRPRPAVLDDEARDGPRQGRPRGGGGGYYDEKAATERVIRELKEIELAKARGELVRADEVADAQATIARRVGDRLEQLATLAGELTSLALAEGESAVRAALRKAVRGLRADLAREIARGGDDDDTDDERPDGVSMAGGRLGLG